MYERIYCIEQLEGLDGEEILGWMKLGDAEIICYSVPESCMARQELYAESIRFYVDALIGHLYLLPARPEYV